VIEASQTIKLDWQRRWCCVSNEIGKEWAATRQNDSDLYCQQLMRLKQSIQEKRPELINEERALSSIVTTPDHTHFWRLGKNWKSLAEKFWCIHYVNLALSDHHLFRSLQNFVNGVNLISNEVCENHLSCFFIQKSQFYTRYMK